LNPARIVL